MKTSFLAPLSVLFLVAAAACTDDDDDVRTDIDRTDPTECTARCSKEKDECVKACTSGGDCATACTDKARDCEVDCD